jgi:lysophospholipid acyltransferase (LPLAT)-like uncharacterized protein
MEAVAGRLPAPISTAPAFQRGTFRFVFALFPTMHEPTTPPAPTPAVEAASVAPSPPRAHVVLGWKRLAALLAGLTMRVWCATLRLRLSPEVSRIIADPSRPTLFVLWHNRLFVAAEIARRLRPARPLHALISASKDGAWLAAFFESVGLRAVRGSSSRGGREAAAALVEVLRAGNDAGLTPDGPRGPAYVCKPGALIVARRARARVVVMGIHYPSAWRIRSWDHFFLPRPFSIVGLNAQVFTEDDLAGDGARERLEARLRELNPDSVAGPGPREPI